MKEKENSKDPLPIADFSVQVFNCLVWPYQKELSTTTSFVLPEEVIVTFELPNMTNLTFLFLS